MNSFFKQVLCFITMVAILYSVLNPVTYFFSRPHGDHAWAQCDRASIALNYFQFDQKLLIPHTHNLVYNSSGIAVGEFPLIPFLVSKLYRCFGFHEFLYRFFILGFSLFGFVIAFLISKDFLKTVLFQLLAATLWLVSPNLIYYSTGFLPDTVALTFFILGFYFLVKGNFKSVRSILLFAVFSSVAVLLKSSVLFLVAATFVALLFSGDKNKAHKSISVKILLLSIPVIICVAWLTYAKQLQILYHSNVFKLGFMSPKTLNDVMQYSFKMAVNLPKIYPLPILILILLSLLLLFKNFNPRNCLHVFTASGFAFWLLFYCLMMRNASFHGYYHVPFQFTVFTLFASAFKIAEEQEWSVTPYRKAGIAFFFFISFALYGNTLQKIYSHYDLVNTDWNTVEPTLRKAGIKNSDKVFSANDKSYNISLYLMNQQGWNGMGDVRESYTFEALKICDYAVLTDTSYLHRPLLSNYFGKEIAKQGSLRVFKLNH